MIHDRLVCADCGTSTDELEDGACPVCGGTEILSLNDLLDSYFSQRSTLDEDLTEEEQVEEILQWYVDDRADDRVDNDGWEWDDFYVDPEEELMFDE